MLFSHMQDYPSVGEVISLLTQYEVVTIFSIGGNALPTYQVLQYTLLQSILIIPGQSWANHVLATCTQDEIVEDVM